jgi:hypothetical protein
MAPQLHAPTLTAPPVPTIRAWASTHSISYSTASNNTAAGYEALYSTTTGYGNTASGYEALQFNTSGIHNSAHGVQALDYNVNGNSNTALGNEALHNNTSGNSNIAVGYLAGDNLTTGSNNINIGSEGVAGESGVIRIGTSLPKLQTATYIAGIYGASVAGAYVCASSTGQLGTNATSCATPSSRRYKEDIQPMAELSERLLKLRPVTFRYKTADADGKKSIQYGLIAEEVAEVFPELVVFNQDGQPDAVRYQVLTPMLLNEVQQQQKAAASQAEKIVAQGAEISQLKQQLAVMQAALIKLQAKNELVAQR